LLSRILALLGVYKLYEKWLMNQMKMSETPEHVAIILDGNRRWAFERFYPSTEGHRFGAKIGDKFLEWCLELGVKTVTVYAFSTENFHRPRNEVDEILQIIERQILNFKEDGRLHENRVKVKAIGKLDLLPQSLQKTLMEIEEATKQYDEHYLNIAVAYGGRAEIVDAVRKIVEDVDANKLKPNQIDEEAFRNYLYTAHLPNPYPDLIIRTSGEERLSGFLLWQSAYSELCFLDVYWPDFRKIDLLRAIRTYQRRKRRYGQ